MSFPHIGGATPGGGGAHGEQERGEWVGAFAGKGRERGEVAGSVSLGTLPLVLLEIPPAFGSFSLICPKRGREVLPA